MHRADYPDHRNRFDLVADAVRLGLGPVQIVLLVLTFLVTVLSVMPRRATLPQAGVHLALLVAYLFLSLA